MKPYIAAVVLFVLLIVSVVVRAQGVHSKSYEYMSVACDNGCESQIAPLSNAGWEVKAVVDRKSIGNSWRVFLQRER